MTDVVGDMQASEWDLLRCVACLSCFQHSWLSSLVKLSKTMDHGKQRSSNHSGGLRLDLEDEQKEAEAQGSLTAVRCGGNSGTAKDLEAPYL